MESNKADDLIDYYSTQIPKLEKQIETEEDQDRKLNLIKRKEIFLQTLDFYLKLKSNKTTKKTTKNDLKRVSFKNK